MEIKITADKKLLDALDKLAEAVKAVVQPTTAPQTAPQAKAEELTTHTTEPATEAPAAPESEAPTPEPVQPEPPKAEAPTRDEVRRVAVAKIQAGLGKAVKDLVAKYGAARVNDVPEDKLAGFKAELEALA